jgi:predicted permease
VLIVGEVALAVMLVTGSALLGRSLQRLVDVDPGFRPEQVIAVSVSLPAPRYPAFEDRSRFFASLVEGARALPGVEHAALSQSIPFLGDYVASISLEGVEYGPGEQPSSNFYAVSSGYFSTMGIPFIRGRDFADGDRADGPRVAIVSQGFASRIFPGRDALGQRFRVSQGPREDFAEVVGIVGDVRHYGLDQDVTLQVYEPARQHPYFSGSQLLLRSALPADATSLAVRRLVLDLDSRLPIGEVTLLEDAVTASTGSRRFTTALLSGLAAIALLLAAVGIYGLVSFSVGRRVQEFGIRIALGAEPSSIMRLVLGQGMRLALAGVAIGLTAGWFASRWLDSLLFEISARDPLAFVLAPAVLVAAITLACWSPARRALRVNPVAALRR